MRRRTGRREWRSAALTRRKIQLFLKILKNCRIEDLKERNKPIWPKRTPISPKPCQTLVFGCFRSVSKTAPPLQNLFGLCSRPQEEAKDGSDWKKLFQKWEDFEHEARGTHGVGLIKPPPKFMIFWVKHEKGRLWVRNVEIWIWVPRVENGSWGNPAVPPCLLLFPFLISSFPPLWLVRQSSLFSPFIRLLSRSSP